MTAPVNLGDVLADKYRVDRILGEGAMGVVVAATHIELGQQVALKFMLGHLASNEAAAERFLREARACVMLRSEHVARVMDVGKLASGAPYIVMEYLEGTDLAAVLESRGTLPVAEAVGYVLHACIAMAEAHQAGIIHRDLKPANLFLTRRPDGSPLIKVLDFGISKVTRGPGLDVTATATAMGSPAYMAPEQMRSAKHVDHRADIWSLGAILYQLLSGELPYFAETVPELFAKALTEEHIPFRAVNTAAPDEVAQAIENCLQQDINRRIQGVGILAAALAPFANERIARSVANIVAEVEPTLLMEVDVPDTDMTGTLAPAGGGPPAGIPETQAPRASSRSPAITVTTHSAATGQRETIGSPRAMIGAVVAVGALASLVAFTILRSSEDAPELTTQSASAASSPSPVLAVPLPDSVNTRRLVAPADAGPSNAPDATDAAPDARANAKLKTASSNNDPIVSNSKHKAKRSSTTRKRRPIRRRRPPTKPTPKRPDHAKHADPFDSML